MGDAVIRRRPLAFRLYVFLLAGGVVASIVQVATTDGHMTEHLLELVVLTTLLTLAEATDLSFYDGRVRFGLSAGEAVLFPMLVALSYGQVLLGAVAAMTIVRAKHWRSDPLKETFNVAQYGCAAFAAAALWHRFADPSPGFGLRDGLLGAAAILLFAALTHIFVPLGIHLARQGRLIDALDVAPAAFINLGANIVLGLFAAAAYSATPWMLVLFPVALASLYIGYRAVVRQTAERTRVERLHAASRSLAGAAELDKALGGFLAAVADVGSALGARAVIKTRTGLFSSSVYEGEEIERLVPVDGSPIEAFFDFVGHTRSTLIYGGDRDSVPVALRAGNSGRNVLCVPVLEEEDVTGLLIVADRVGADEFGPAEGRLLEALANELALTLQSYRLFEEVNEEKERFQLLVEAVTDYAIYMLDPQGHVASWNSGAERILGYPSDEIAGRHHAVFYPPEMEGTWNDELHEAAIKGRLETEGFRLRKDGSLFLANIVITPVRDPQGDLRGFATITRDITERVGAMKEKETLQAQLHQAQKLESVGQLAGGIAHDFNNLLSVVSNSAHFLLEQAGPGDETREELLEIKGAARRGAALTRQLLIFSRRDRVTPEILQLNDVIRGALNLLTRALGEQVVVRSLLADDIGLVKVDEGQIEQVLLNLSINARDAMAGGGTLSIETSKVRLDAGAANLYMDLQPGSYIRLTVSDTGCGMDPSVIEKAFDPFFTTKTKGGGTGLGLATVYGIVKGAGGHIGITSSEGVGTVFEILLPEVFEDVKVRVLEIEQPHAPGGRGETVLLVEDDTAVMAITRRMLQANGYEVIEASGGKEALGKFDDNAADIDLVLTDVIMPDMSGVELCDRLRVPAPSVKAIFMSGYSAGVFSADSEKMDVPLIQKPFGQDELLQLVRQVLDTTTELGRTPS